MNPNVSKAVAEADSLLAWVKAQALTLWSQHKVATVVVAACGFVSGCVLH